MKKINLLEPFEAKGWWFLPEAKDKIITGILRFAPNEGIQLDLIGSLSDSQQEFLEFFNSKRYEVIQGETEHGKKITLINCQKSGSSFLSQMAPIVYISAEILLENIWLSYKDEKLFNKVEFSNPKLAQWVGWNTSVMTIEHTEPTPTIKMEISAKHNVVFSHSLDSESKLNIISGSGFKWEGNDYHIQQQAHISIEYTTNKDISFLVRQVQIINALISLGHLENLPISSLNVFNTVQEADRKQEDGWVNVIYGQHLDQFNDGEQHPLFTYNDIKEISEEAIINWVKNNDEMLPIRQHLLTAVSKQRSRFDSTDFLVIAFAIEGFHTRFKKKEVGIRQVVINLLDEYKGIMYLKNIKVNPNEVADSRNYYSHLFPETKKPNVLFGGKLLMLTENLKALLITSLLLEIGFTDQMIDQALRSYNVRVYYK